MTSAKVRSVFLKYRMRHASMMKLSAVEMRKLGRCTCHGSAESIDRAHDRLLVAHQHIAPREEAEQFTMAPQVRPVVGFRATCFYYQ